MSESLDKIWDLFDAHTATVYFPDYVNIKNELKAFEIIKKYIYYSDKSHCFRMREIRKSTHNFDYEELREVLGNE